MYSDIAKGSPKDAADFLVALDPPCETELELEDSGRLTHYQIMMIFAQLFAAGEAGVGRMSW